MPRSNDNLVEGAAALLEIEYATSRGAFYPNRAPVVRGPGVPVSRGGAVPALSAAATEQMSLFGSVADEGSPRGAALTAAWQLVGGAAR